jgi:hypothetical protein
VKQAKQKPSSKAKATIRNPKKMAGKAKSRGLKKTAAPAKRPQRSGTKESTTATGSSVAAYEVIETEVYADSSAVINDLDEEFGT